MAEEFEESEVIFDQESVDDEDHRNEVCDFRELQLSNTARRKKVKPKPINNNMKNSAPVNIPENVSRNSWLRYMEYSDLDGDDGEMVPPHVILGRRVMVHSVCTGKGRTLKGRDLSQVRNSILKMTGFLEN